MTFHSSQYMVRTDDEEVPAHSLEEAVAIASDFIDTASGPVEVIDGAGTIVFDQPELVERIMMYRESQKPHGSSLRQTPPSPV